MVTKLPDGYYNTYDPDTKKWVFVLFNPSQPVQASEVNAMQMIRIAQMEKLARASGLADGQFTIGGLIDITIDNSPADPAYPIKIAIGAGELWAGGYFHDVPAGTCNIKGVGDEVVSLSIVNYVITSVDDSDLLDPVLNAENYMQPGADRLTFTYSYVYGANGVPIAHFKDGQLVKGANGQSNTGGNSFDDILALRTYEQSGSFLTTRPTLNVTDLELPLQNPVQMDLEIDNGVVYVRGYRRTNQKLHLSIRRAIDTAPRVAEVFPFVTGTNTYTLTDPPVISVSSVTCVTTSPVINMSRGMIVNGSDAIPTYNPVAAIITVNQGGTWTGTSVSGGTTYVQGTDYNKVGDSIQWISTGSQPDPGTSYEMVVTYSKVLDRATWTQTLVTNESHSGSGGTFTLTQHPLQNIVSIGSYKEGVDFSVNTYTGVVTWLITPPGGTVLVTYNYWVITVAGDYVSRDSFRTAAGAQVYYGYPSYDASGAAIDYTSQISFNTVGGKKPVNGSNVFINYNYALPRTDALVWNVDGTISLIQGTPSAAPAAPTVSDQAVGIAKILVPADSFASGVTIQFYDNLTLKVTELRNMLHRIIDLEFDIAQFQLAANTAGISAPTDKRGIFADPLKTRALADIFNPTFDGTFDFIGQKFLLPRNEIVFKPTITSSTADLMGDMWITSHTEVLGLSQPYASAKVAINQIDNTAPQPTTGAVAKVTLSPSTITETQDLVHVRTYGDDFSSYNGLLYPGGNPNFNEAAPSFGGAAILDNTAGSGAIPRSSIANSHLMNAIAPSTSVAAKNAASYQPQVNPTVGKIVYRNQFGEDVSNNPIYPNVDQWSTAQLHHHHVTATEEWPPVVSGTDTHTQPKPPATSPYVITATGTGFKPLCTIHCLFNQSPMKLNGTTTISADSSGNFTATFTVPDGTPEGNYPVEFNGFDNTNITTPVSFASAQLVIQSTSISIATDHTQVAGGHSTIHRTSLHAYLIPMNIYHALNPGATSFPDTVWPTDVTIKASNGPLSTLIAQVVKQMINRGDVLTVNAVVTAVESSLAFSTLSSQFTHAQVVSMVEALNLTSTDVATNTIQVETDQPQAAQNVASNSKIILEPRAQIFTPSRNMFATSLELFFGDSLTAGQNVVLTLSEVDASGFPTGVPLATVIRNTVSTSTDSYTGTKFTFDKTISLKANTAYGFTVSTNDTVLSLWMGTIGANDLLSGNVIASGSGIGNALFSPNQQNWQIDAGKNIKFNLYSSDFVAQAILELGLVTFGQPTVQFSMNAIHSEPSSDCSVVFQYSSDNTHWVDFAPMVEVNLATAADALYFRILMNGSSTQCPTVVDGVEILTYNFKLSGAYLNRNFQLFHDDTQNVELWVDCYIPGGTAVTAEVSFDAGSTWNNMTVVTADTQPLTDTVSMYHFTYDSGTDDKTQVQCRITLSSTTSRISPYIQNVRIIAR